MNIPLPSPPKKCDICATSFSWTGDAVETQITELISDGAGLEAGFG